MTATVDRDAALEAAVTADVEEEPPGSVVGRRVVLGMLASLPLAPLAAGGGLLFLAGAVAGGGTVGQPGGDVDACRGGTLAPGTPGRYAGVTLDGEQLGHAATIASAAAGVFPAALLGRAQIVALATAMQESGLRNLDYGDRDSLGLFQQRPSTGWGTPAQVRDPELAAAAFYGAAAHTRNPGLVDVEGWWRMPVTVAAQRVQRSAFPDAYARWEAMAGVVVASMSGRPVSPPPGCDDVAPMPGRWVLPLAPPVVVTSGFGMRWGRLHAGLDFGAPPGTPIRAVAAGRVTYAGWASGYGAVAYVAHGDGVATRYAHMHATPVVATGQHVTAGQHLGGVGSTGRSTGPHLHLEVRVDGVPRDPRPWLERRGVDLPDAA